MQPLSSQNYLDEIKIKWENAHKYMMELASAVPDSLFDFHPTEESMTLQQQLIHMGNNMVWLAGNQLGYAETDPPEIQSESPTPRETRSYLDLAFEFALQALERESQTTLDKISEDFFAGPKTHRQIINLMNDHVAHHRGQIIVYLRLNGIRPPRYVGW